MRGSNDRLRRVRGYGRHRDGARVAANLVDKGSHEDDTWAAADVGQPFAILVKPVVVTDGDSLHLSGTWLVEEQWVRDQIKF